MSNFSKKYLFLRSLFNDFLKQNPALLIGWVACICIALYFNKLCSFWGLGPLLVLLDKKALLKLFIPFFCGCWIFLSFWLGPVGFKESVEGRARVHIYEKKLTHSAFGTAWVLKGFVQEFRGENGVKMRHFPFSAYVPKEVVLPTLNKEYWVSSQVQKSDFYGYRLKLKKGAHFEKVQKSFSLAALRYQLKNKFKKWIKKLIPYKRARSLLIGMSTGDFDDTFLSFTFSRFGLNHLLAISGFHFAILALFMSFVLKWVPFKARNLILGLLLTFFYFFVGYSPSLQRAWLVALIYLLGSYYYQMMSALNVLSLALCIALLFNPYMLFNMGFQFSFAVTYAILIYYPPLYKKFSSWVPSKNRIEHALVQLLALGAAVHFAAIPLSLFHFHKFYFLGFFFNLFVPALVSLLLIGFMSALLIYPVLQPASKLLMHGVGFLTEKMLEFIFWVPTSLDYCIRASFVSASLLVVYFSLFFILAGSLQLKKRAVFIDYAVE